VTFRILAARFALGGFALGLLAACSEKPSAAADSDTTQEAGYLAPPRVETVRPGPGGVTLSGIAAPGGQVRLATPAGQVQFAPADARGHWTVVLPASAQARIFGLSATTHGRSAQAEGYLLVTPSGQGALLRAGASAVRIDPPAKPGLRAVDFDRGGGMEISAGVAPGSVVTMLMDGRQIAQGRADSAGRYQVSLGGQTPVKPGAHRIQVFGDGYALMDQATVQVSAAAPLAEGPVRSQLTSAGLRVDWLTPGGGVQSTLLVH
jgi:hypothetical protein